MDQAGGLYAKLEERILARDQIGASAVYYDLVRAKRPRAEIVRETVRIHAPYTHVPYHQRINDGFVRRPAPRGPPIRGVYVAYALVPLSALREAHQRIRELERLLGKKQMEIEILQAAQEVVKKSPWLRKGPGR